MQCYVQAQYVSGFEKLGAKFEFCNKGFKINSEVLKMDKLRPSYLQLQDVIKVHRGITNIFGFTAKTTYVQS